MVEGKNISRTNLEKLLITIILFLVAFITFLILLLFSGV